MTGELLEDSISSKHPGENADFFSAGQLHSRGVEFEQRVRAWRLGRPTYEEMVIIKVELPARLNDLLEQFKILKRIPKTDMITFALDELLQQP